jgi:hypothetical protein
MNLPRLLLAQVVCLVLTAAAVEAHTSPRAGFYLPDDIREATIRYKTFRNLILLPVIINDSIHVNLILDTGCRNLVLFGKRFKKLFQMEPGKKVQFSGLGEGDPVYGALSLRNKVSISEVLGEHIPVVVVPNRNVFDNMDHVDGVIGYDIFIKFEVELNPLEKLITFRPAFTALLPPSYQQVPIRIEDSRPILQSRIVIENEELPCNLMIDTGSALGLLLKTTDLKRFEGKDVSTNLGFGFNGAINGYETRASLLEVEGFLLNMVPTGVIQSRWHNYASIGMGVLKGYSIVLNYCKEYVGFKKL